MKKALLPIGLRLKLKKQEKPQITEKDPATKQQVNDGGTKTAKLLSLDEQIKALEEVVNSDSSETEDKDDDKSPENDLVAEYDKDGNIIRYYSALQEVEKIVPLKKSLLPQPKCLFVNHERASDSQKRKVQFVDEQSKSNPEKKLKVAQSPSTFSSMQKALDSYIPSSHVKLPFYCRVCQIQSSNLEEFENHKVSDGHLEKLRFDKQLSYCHLCRKQFTSPEQLKEHKKGKAHLERLEKRNQASHNMQKFSRY